MLKDSLKLKGLPMLKAMVKPKNLLKVKLMRSEKPKQMGLQKPKRMLMEKETLILKPKIQPQQLLLFQPNIPYLF